MAKPKMYLHTGTLETCLDNIIALTVTWPTQYLSIMFNMKSRYYCVVDDTFLEKEHNHPDDEHIRLVMRITKLELINLHKYFDGMQIRMDIN